VLAKKTVKNQLTLPKRVADTFPGVDYFEVRVDRGRIILSPVRPGQVDQVRAKLRRLGVTEAVWPHWELARGSRPSKCSGSGSLAHH
jgi:hypothetical protein